MPQPPWLAAMLQQMYPGGSMDTAYSNNPWNQPMPNPPLPAAGGRIPEMQTPIAGVDPRLIPAATGVPMPRGLNAPRGRPSATPNIDPTRVGGAPSPGVPAPQNFNRSANNPPYAVPIQYGVPGSGRGGMNPIYTAANFAGPQPQAPTPPPAPRGALAANAPQAAPGPDVSGMFANLPNNIFGGFGGRGGANWWDQVDPQALAALHSGFA